MAVPHSDRENRISLAKVDEIVRLGAEQACDYEVSIKQLSLFVFLAVHLQVRQKTHKLRVSTRIVPFRDSLVHLDFQLKNEKNKRG
jgi:hypothetical protein